MATARAPVPAPYSRRTNGTGRSSRSQASATARDSAAPKIGCASGAVRKSPSRPGPGRRRPVVAAGRVVQREVHEPGERHRAVARDLRVDPGHQLGVLADRVEIRVRVAAQTRRGVHHAARRPAADDEPDTRSDERVAAEQDRDRRRGGGRGQLRAATDRRCARRAAGPTRNGPRRPASRPRRRRAGGRGARGCRRSRRRDSCARWLPSDPGPSRSISAPRTEAGGRWPATLVRRPRSSTSARVRAAVERSSQASVAADVRPATRSSARRVARHGADGRQAFAHTGCVDGAGPVTGRSRPGRPADEDEIQRAVDVDAEPPSASEVAHRVAGHLGKPARERVVGRKVRQVRQHVRGAG